MGLRLGSHWATPRLTLLLDFPKSEMLRVMNFVIIPALLGPLLGPFMGGFIVHWLPWRMWSIRHRWNRGEPHSGEYDLPMCG